MGHPDSGIGEPVDAQQAFWNHWNATYRANQRGAASQRQAAVVRDWLTASGRHELDILDVGCGSGWMADILLPFGRVTATDLADDVLRVAQQKWPGVHFVAGDFLALDFPPASQDVVVTLETLSHVPDQPAFITNIARILRPGGLLMIATQNRFVLERASVTPRAYGQIRRWVTPGELRTLLSSAMRVEQLFTVYPFGHGGMLRLINSPKLNGIASLVTPQATIDHWKEAAGLGHTIMALARKSH